MPLFVNVAPTQLLPTSFVFQVPGDQQWLVRSVYATVYRDVGGTPNRSYTLQITDGTNVVAAVGANDTGAEPGTGHITWIDSDPSLVSAGADAVIVAPFATQTVDAGYLIIGTIVAPAAADQWLEVVCWYDFEYTT